MRALLVFAIVALASVCIAQQPKPQPLKGKELADFLGPVSPRAFHWSKYTLIDFELYNGEAQPPLSGHASFYVGGHPDFKPPVGSKQIRGDLGRYAVTWYRAVDKHGLISQDALIPLDDYWQIDRTSCRSIRNRHQQFRTAQANGGSDLARGRIPAESSSVFRN